MSTPREAEIGVTGPQPRNTWSPREPLEGARPCRLLYSDFWPLGQ